MIGAVRLATLRHRHVTELRRPTSLDDELARPKRAAHDGHRTRQDGRQSRMVL